MCILNKSRWGIENQNTISLATTQLLESRRDESSELSAKDADSVLGIIVMSHIAARRFSGGLS
jgi:hypothetical protein